MLNILVVEDDIPIRDMLRDVLQESDFGVQVAADTQRAFELVQKQIPDLILLDWMLPGQTGLEWARRLKKDELYADILRRVFNAPAKQRLKLVNIKNSKGELALRVGDAQPFGLISAAPRPPMR